MLGCNGASSPPADGGGEGEGESEGEGSAVELVATIDVPSGARDVAFRGTSLLVLGVDDLTVYDVSDPANPADIGSTGWGGEGMYIDETDTLFVATGMTVIEATLDSTIPAQQIEYTFGPRAATRVYVVGERAYVASQNDFLALDLSAKSPLLGSVGVGGEVQDLAGSTGGLAFNAATGRGMMMVELATYPPAPGADFYQVEVEGDALAVFALGEAVVMTGAAGEIAIHDFADLSHPERLSRTFLGGRVFALASNRLYVIGEPCRGDRPGMHIIDVSQLDAPNELECQPMPDGTLPELRTEPTNGRAMAVVGVLVALAVDTEVQVLELP